MSNQNFISLSDLHFNPCFDPEITPLLVQAPPREWASLYKTSKVTRPYDYGRDTNYPLLSSLLETLAQFPDAGFVLFSGDFLGHRLHSQFARQTGIQDESAFEEFIGKTIEFLHEQFTSALPGRIIFPCLGNDDSVSGDYSIIPHDPFLDMYLSVWQPSIAFPSEQDRAQFQRTYLHGS